MTMRHNRSVTCTLRVEGRSSTPALDALRVCDQPADIAEQNIQPRACSRFRVFLDNVTLAQCGTRV